MLPFALVIADFGSAVQEGVQLVGCCYLENGLECGLMPVRCPRAKLAVTRTRRKLFDFRHSNNYVKSAYDNRSSLFGYVPVIVSV